MHVRRADGLDALDGFVLCLLPRDLVVDSEVEHLASAERAELLDSALGDIRALSRAKQGERLDAGEWDERWGRERGLDESRIWKDKGSQLRIVHGVWREESRRLGCPVRF